MWERYCQGVSAILFVVDSSIALPSDELKSKQGSSASDAWYIAADALNSLVDSDVLSGIPVLVLATKNDRKGAATTEDVIRVL